MTTVSLVGFVKIELPEGDVLLCDAGFVDYAGDTYLAKHPTFGMVGAVRSLNEGAGDEVPALEMTLFPIGADPADLSKPGHQRSRVRFWIGEYDADAGTLDGTPDLLFDGQIDQTTLTVGKDVRELAISVVSTAERLFEINLGNSLNDTFHQSVWPGELGHKNATGLSIPVAWGVESPPRSWSGGGGGTFGGYGGGTMIERPWRI